MTQFAQRFRLDLADALTGNVEFLGQFLQSDLFAVISVDVLGNAG